MRDRFYWAECNAHSTPFTADRLQFHKFSTEGMANIRKVAGPEQEFVWLKATFILPKELENKSLGLSISYLHYAEKAWINDTYIGGYGDFPPHTKCAWWGSHFYSIPEPLLKRGERNTILIKVFCQGKSGISDNVILGEHDFIQKQNLSRNFMQTVIYFFAAGGMFFTAILFLMIFIWRIKEREYLSFSLLCIASVIFITPFFGSILPAGITNAISALLFTKLTLCEGLFLMSFFLSSLIIEFVKRREPPVFRAIRFAILILSSLIVLLAPNYKALIRIGPIPFLLSVVQLLMGFALIIKNLAKETGLKNFLVLSASFIPLLVSIALDILIKLVFEKVDYPYISLFGWLVTIIVFIVILSIRYNRALNQNEYLNIKLRREVLKQTRELSKKNSTLTEEIRRAETDLEMASLVQKKFFPYPPKTLRGWDIAVSYSPLDKVSGDMYDFYLDKDNLNGFSLFDVSGHGIAASLVTMLAKNIIFQSFIRNMRNNETVSRTLYEINEEIIEAKGGIENYLTGLMFRFKPFDKNDDCVVEMANAGHPNPLLYSAKSNICDEIESGDSEEHHGAIGLDFITVSFPQINFTMGEDDILIFYTDGLTESRNRANEMFGKERLKRILKESFAKDAQSIMEDIIDAFQRFTNGVKRDDDITVVVMKRENSINFVEELDDADDFLG
ncbi:MAG: SpoIIE family protein phosphatase [Treponema sp.]|nr:SpoIIE family protein phosphatase [Treponema sp.]